MSNRIEGLDALRGLAILLVMLRHAWPETFGGGGIVGVVVFFTLSGYLITAILHRSITRHGKVRYGRFYRDRAFRLIPALVLMLVGITIVSLATNLLGDRGDLLRTWLVALSYTGNLPFDHGSPGINHIWTLATEEQFYLVWPVVLTLGLRWRKLWWVIGVSGLAILAVCAASLVFYAPAYGSAYTLPSSWAITILIGAAAYFARDRVAASFPDRGFLPVGAAAVALLAMSVIPDFKESPFAYLLGGPAIAGLTVVIIAYARHWQTVSAAFKPMLWLGTVSYAAYLWNLPITLWIEAAHVPFAPILSLVLTVFAAAVSWFAVERPVRELKRRLDS